MKKLWLIMMMLFVLCGCSAEKYDVEENADVEAVEVFDEDEVFVSENDASEIEEAASAEIIENESVDDSTEQVGEVATAEEAAATEKIKFEAEPVEEKVSYDIIGNKKSKKYHLPSCHTLPYPENQIFFESTEEASNKGYKPCKNCRP